MRRRMLATGRATSTIRRAMSTAATTATGTAAADRPGQRERSTAHGGFRARHHHIRPGQQHRSNVAHTMRHQFLKPPRFVEKRQIFIGGFFHQEFHKQRIANRMWQHIPQIGVQSRGT